MRRAIVSQHCESGFTMLEMTYALLILPFFLYLLVHVTTLGQALYEQPKFEHQTTPQLIVRRIVDSRDCRIDDGRLRGTFVKEDGTVWDWTIKQINGNLVMVGDEGGNLLFLRGVEAYHVETIGIGYRITWNTVNAQKEKAVLCMKTDSSSSLPSS